MQSGDGLVVRVRPRGSKLTPEQTLGIAEASAKYGNGLIDLTARGNLQLRGVQADRHHALIDDLAVLRLVDALRFLFLLALPLGPLRSSKSSPSFNYRRLLAFRRHL